MAKSSSSSTGIESVTSILDALAAQESVDAKTAVISKHDKLKMKMEVLQAERKADAKKRKMLTASLKAAKRAKARIAKKAMSLSAEDILQVLCVKHGQAVKKQNKKGKATTDNAEDADVASVSGE